MGLSQTSPIPRSPDGDNNNYNDNEHVANNNGKNLTLPIQKTTLRQFKVELLSVAPVIKGCFPIYWGFRTFLFPKSQNHILNLTYSLVQEM